ncbi:hypothetical protein HDU97_006704 [Phlyctochytrium planicorne]|nr:hypothetical protein HDU97_006704 [Phlyctochytrium planicorne]
MEQTVINGKEVTTLVFGKDTVVFWIASNVFDNEGLRSLSDLDTSEALSENIQIEEGIKPNRLMIRDVRPNTPPFSLYGVVAYCFGMAPELDNSHPIDSLRYGMRIEDESGRLDITLFGKLALDCVDLQLGEMVYISNLQCQAGRGKFPKAPNVVGKKETRVYRISHILGFLNSSICIAAAMKDTLTNRFASAGSFLCSVSAHVVIEAKPFKILHVEGWWTLSRNIAPIV